MGSILSRLDNTKKYGAVNREHFVLQSMERAPNTGSHHCHFFRVLIVSLNHEMLDNTTDFIHQTVV